MQSEVKVLYLDVGTLGGNLEEILCDLQLIEKEAADLGLHLNRNKSELICEDLTTRDQILRAAPGLHTTDMDQAETMGASVEVTR